MRRLAAVLVLAAAVAGCKKSEAPAPPPPPVAEAPTTTTVKGTVLEKLEAPPYSYLKLKTGSGETWVAVPKADVEKGKEVAVANAMPMNGFESKTLNRKFDVVFFGTLEGAAPAGMPAMPGAGAPAEGGPVNMAQQHAMAAAGPSDVGDVKVPKAGGADARTVAEVYAQRTALKEKPVTIRGKVVKFNGNIMGKNWVHLRDGSGNGQKGDNDLTITTADQAQVGDVVVVKGVVRVDKDFGAGYAYPVIVEDARLGK